MAVPVAASGQPAGRSHTVELVGPAGAGKSALTRFLSSRHRSFRPPLTAWDLSPWLLAVHGLRQLAYFGRAARSPLRFDFRSFSDLTHVMALYARVRAEDSRRHRVVLLDEGPVFLLTSMLAYRPAALRAEGVRKRWLEALQQAAGAIDRIFWIDAPDHLLAHRIRQRAKPHQVKDANDATIADFSARYRAAFLEVAHLFAEQGGPMVTGFTSSEPLPRVANRVAHELGTNHVD